MRETIKLYIKNCDTCQRSKAFRHALYGLLQPNEVPDQPWRSIAMDFITELPNSNGYDTILVFIDRLTKMSHCLPCQKDLDTQQFATLFMKHIVRLHSILRDIITDRGSLFTSELWKETTKNLGIQRRLSTAFHPQTVGQTERMNAILQHYLRSYINYRQDNWSDLLAIAEFAYNEWISRNKQNHPILCKLRKKSRTSTNEPDDQGRGNNGQKYGKSSPNTTRANEDRKTETKRKLRSTQKA